MSIIWEWIPNFSLGPIKLGEQISQYVESFCLIKEDDEEHDDITNWVSYDFPSMDAYIDAKNGIIIAITSYEQFVYKGKNIVGIKVTQLRELLDGDPDEIGVSVLYDDGDIQTPFRYSSLGLLLWVRDEEVVYASCIKCDDEYI